MNSFEIQSEADAQTDRKTIKDVLAPSNSNFNINNNNNNQQQQQRTGGIVTSAIQQFNTVIGMPATPSRTKAMSDARKLNSPNGKIVNVIDEHIYSVFISCIEIYNNYIYDLLDEFSTSSDSTKYLK